MIYQVKLGEFVLYTGDLVQTLEYLTKFREEDGKHSFPKCFKQLDVFGFELGKQSKIIPYHEKASGFIM